MLAVSKYPQAYVDQTRAQLDADVAAFATLSSPGEFEATFFNNLVIVLDRYFLHRTRAIEGKDGNPLNEARLIANSLTESGGVMTAEKAIKFKPAESLLKIEFGERIKLSEADFRLLAAGFLAEIERRFS